MSNSTPTLTSRTRAESLLLPEGKVFVRGELWDAWSPTKVERGEPVRVVGVRGLRLEVAPASADHSFPRPVSAIPSDSDADG